MKFASPKNPRKWKSFYEVALFSFGENIPPLSYSRVMAFYLRPFKASFKGQPVQLIQKIVQKTRYVMPKKSHECVFMRKKNLFDFQESVIFETPPLGIVPGGSGNGMAKTISYFNNETFSALNSCYNVIKGQPKDMDLTRLTTDKGKVYYSFLSVAYGFTSDVDIESECIRFLVSVLFFSFTKPFTSSPP